MNYLLDTCVVSEFAKRAPSPNVIRWLAEVDENKLFLSVITLGEVRRGLERLSDSPRKVQLNEWLNEELIRRISSRLVQIDSEVMLLWGGLTARLEKEGKAMPVIDSLIAASALYHHLYLVTCNDSDFAHTDLPVINPWE